MHDLSKKFTNGIAFETLITKARSKEQMAMIATDHLKAQRWEDFIENLVTLQKEAEI